VSGAHPRQQMAIGSPAATTTLPAVSDIVTAAASSGRTARPRKLEPLGRPDLVVVGNQVRPSTRRAGGQASGAPAQQARSSSSSRSPGHGSALGLRHPRQDDHSALLIHMLRALRMDPGFRLGSTSLDVAGAPGFGTGPFVFEGDEYTTAPGPRPSFSTCGLRRLRDPVGVGPPDVYRPRGVPDAFVSWRRRCDRRAAVLCGTTPRRWSCAPTPPAGRRLREGEGLTGGCPARRRRLGAALPGRLP